MPGKEVKITVERVLGAVSIFAQGGSPRLVLPKSALRVLGIKMEMIQEEDDPEKLTFVLLATNKGLILRALQDYLNDEEMKPIGP